MTGAAEHKPEQHALKPLEIPKPIVRALNYASALENKEVEQELGFSARVFAQVSLPYRNPGDAPFWLRRNGDTTLTVQPAVLTDPAGKSYTAYPHGLTPRQILTWMATEAYNTKSRELELGSSMNRFMEKLGIAHNGQNGKKLTDNLRRLFGSTLSVEGMGSTDTGHGSQNSRFHVADSVQLWFSHKDEEEDENPGLWTSKVTLSERFYNSIVDNPIPIDLRAMEQLGSSPMRLDMLLWLSYRMFYLEGVSRVTWKQLDDQFGGQYKRLDQFKTQFLKNLAVVRAIYPALNVDVHPQYLILRRSNTFVPPIPGSAPKKATLHLLGDKYPEIAPAVLKTTLQGEGAASSQPPSTGLILPL